MSGIDEIRYMGLALEEAEVAEREGEVPIGAVIVREGEIISRAHNEVEKRQDPTAHAEILAIRRAGEKLGNWRLNGCEMYVTIEPCPMCTMASILARISRVIYGAKDIRMGGLGTKVNLNKRGLFNHYIEVKGGIRAEEAEEIIRRFFKRIREERGEVPKWS